MKNPIQTIKILSKETKEAILVFREILSLEKQLEEKREELGIKVCKVPEDEFVLYVKVTEAYAQL